MAGTGIRNTHRIGSYLMRDDESGFVEYRENMVKIWNGTWRHKKMFETRQPQEFVQARSDPRALRHIRPDIITDKPVTAAGCIGLTSVLRPTAPATHAFEFLDVLFDEVGVILLDEEGNCLLEES